MKNRLLITALVLPTLFWLKTTWLPGSQGLPIAYAPQATQTTTIELANHLEQVANGIFLHGSYAYLVPTIYTWAPAPDGGQGTDVATYTWPRSFWYPTGDKTVSVMAVNAEGTAIDTHTITIYPVAVYLPIVVKTHE